MDPEHAVALLRAARGQREQGAKKGECTESFHVNLIKGLTGFATFAV
jgi:hypothetical protein